MTETEQLENRTTTPRPVEARQISLREFYTVIFVHKWTIFLAFIIMFAGIIWGLSLRDRLYIASVKFFVNRYLPQQAALRYIGRLEWEEEINTMAEMGRSQGVLTSAAKEFDMARGHPDPPLLRQQLIAGGLATMVEVLPVPETNIINILVRDTDADTSLMIAEIYGRAFKDEYWRVSHLSHGRTFFANAIEDVEKKIDDAWQAKARIQEENDLYNYSDEGIALNASIHMMMRELTQKRVEREILEKQIEFERRFFDEGDDFVMTSFLRTDELIRQLEYRVADLRMNLSEFESRYTEDHPLVISKREELDTALKHRNGMIQKAILEHEQQLQEILQGEKVLAESMADLRERLDIIPENAMQIAYYDSYITMQWKLYSELIIKFNDTQASEEQSLLENQLVQLGPANIGGVVGETPRVVYAVVAPIFAMLLAIAIAFMAEATNHTFQKTADIEDYSGLPVLATFRKL